MHGAHSLGERVILVERHAAASRVILASHVKYLDGHIVIVSLLVDKTPIKILSKPPRVFRGLFVSCDCIVMLVQLVIARRHVDKSAGIVRRDLKALFKVRDRCQRLSLRVQNVAVVEMRLTIARYHSNNAFPERLGRTPVLIAPNCARTKSDEKNHWTDETGFVETA